MVHFETEPQPPISDIYKEQLTGLQVFDQQKHYDIKIRFVDVYLGRKYAKVYLTNQIVDGDLPYIYDEKFQFLVKDFHLRIRNYSPLYQVLRRLLITDGHLPKTEDKAILITPIELKEYLTNRTFRVKGENIHSYKNVTAIPGGDSQWEH